MKLRQIVRGTVSLSALTVMLIACQNFEEDVLPITEIEDRSIQVVAQQPEVIDVLEGVISEEPIRIEIAKAPNEGEFEMRGRSLGLYNIEAPPGTRDEFTIAMEMSSGTVLRTFSVESVNRVNYPISEQGALYDRGGVLRKGQTITVDVLANDARGASALQIIVPPISGLAEVTNDNKIKYSAPTDFEGLDDLIYTVVFPNGTIGKALVRFAIQ